MPIRDGQDREPRIDARPRLASAESTAVLALATAATAADGVSPLSEHVMLHLRYGGDHQARDLLVHRDGEIAGYAHLDPASPGEGPSGELVIHPGYRNQGLGLALARALVAEAGGQPLRVWAHGDRPAAARLAAAAGFGQVRSLWQMRRPLADEIAPPKVAEGIVIRPFEVGRDEDAWLAVNARAFAHHPEQGGWTGDDLRMREQEPWFDPDGFFLAERDGRLVGFHWTKVHDEGPEPIGEVYVVGVDPGEQGTGLGRALTVIGLRHLRSRQLSHVMLYVDGTNTAAIRLYESLGFSRWNTDVMFEHPGQSGHPGQPEG
jgi:mycothiol synthase